MRGAILFVLAAVSSGAAGTPDACALLSPAAIQKVIGDEVTNQKGSVETAGEVRKAQCFYSLRTFTNSISVTLTAPLPGASRDATQELWRRWFHPRTEDGESQQDRNHERRESEEDAGAKAVPMAGVGEEAFWVHSFVGNLYVRKGELLLRISLGGKMNDEERQVKARALANEALRHLNSSRRAGE